MAGENAKSAWNVCRQVICVLLFDKVRRQRLLDKGTNLQIFVKVLPDIDYPQHPIE